MATHRIELPPKDREYVALIEAEFARAQFERQRRLGLLLSEHGIPDGVQVTFDSSAMTFVLPDPPTEPLPPDQSEAVVG